MIFDEIDKVVNKFYKETEHLSRGTMKTEKDKLIDAWDKLDRAWGYIVDIIDYPEDYDKDRLVRLTENYGDYVYQARKILAELGYKGEEA